MLFLFIFMWSLGWQRNLVHCVWFFMLIKTGLLSTVLVIVGKYDFPLCLFKGCLEMNLSTHTSYTLDFSSARSILSFRSWSSTKRPFTVWSSPQLNSCHSPWHWQQKLDGHVCITCSERSNLTGHMLKRCNYGNVQGDVKKKKRQQTLKKCKPPLLSGIPSIPRFMW